MSRKSRRGGPIVRYGGKGHLAPMLIPYFAPAQTWAESHFGGGSVFFALPPGLYNRSAINDIDASLVTFFRVLRDRPDDLVRVCELTPYARDEFVACRERSADALEEARRVWVRSRQAFSGSDTGGWKCNAGDTRGWAPSQTSHKLAALLGYASALRDVAIDNTDAAQFIDRWGQADTFVYADPTYPGDTRNGPDDYRHEMSAEDHRRQAASLRAAATRGAKVAVSTYPNALYDELFDGWRTETLDVASCAASERKGERRLERLHLSYPATESFGAVRQLSLMGGVS